MEQQAANVWRKRAFWAMKAAHDQFGKDTPGSDRLLGCIETFRERVDHDVENSVPVGMVRGVGNDHRMVGFDECRLIIGLTKGMLSPSVDLT